MLEIEPCWRLAEGNSVAVGYAAGAVRSAWARLSCSRRAFNWRASNSPTVRPRHGSAIP